MSSADRTLLDRWIARRDAEAFSTITSRHAPMVYATCRRILGNAADAEDASQECFEALAGASKAPRTDSVGAWLHGIATKRCLQHMRSEGRRRIRETHFAGAEATPHTATWDDILHLVDEAVAELPDDLREPVVAHFLNGESQAAVAKATGVSRQTITYRVAKGIERIRRSLKRRGVDVPAPGLTAMMGTHLAQHGPVPASLTASLGKMALSGAAKPMAIAMTVAGGMFTMKKVLLAVVLILVGVGIALTIAGRNRAKDTAGDQQILPEPSTAAYTPPGSQSPTNAEVPTDNAFAAADISVELPPDLPPTPEPAKHEDPNAASEKQDDTETVVEDVLVVLGAFFAAAGDGDGEAAVALCTPPNKNHGDDAVEMGQRLVTASSDVAFDIYGDVRHALAVSELIGLTEGGPEDETGFLVFTLLKTEDGEWLIDDIDYENHEGAVGEIDRFLLMFKSAEMLTPQR